MLQTPVSVAIVKKRAPIQLSRELAWKFECNPLPLPFPKRIDNDNVVAVDVAGKKEDRVETQPQPQMPTAVVAASSSSSSSSTAELESESSWMQHIPTSAYIRNVQMDGDRATVSSSGYSPSPASPSPQTILSDFAWLDTLFSSDEDPNHDNSSMLFTFPSFEETLVAAAVETATAATVVETTTAAEPTTTTTTAGYFDDLFDGIISPQPVAAEATNDVTPIKKKRGIARSHADMIASTRKVIREEDILQQYREKLAKVQPAFQRPPPPVAAAAADAVAVAVAVATS